MAIVDILLGIILGIIIARVSTLRTIFIESLKNINNYTQIEITENGDGSREIKVKVATGS